MRCIACSFDGGLVNAVKALILLAVIYCGGFKKCLKGPCVFNTVVPPSTLQLGLFFAQNTNMCASSGTYVTCYAKLCRK